ncbi:MAG: glucosyltransferase domain-containing protein [Lachnospiraceae bacterium]|nr:glucosyltransferase domain-containing protein [Lachnospiraceae bacterium]
MEHTPTKFISSYWKRLKPLWKVTFLTTALVMLCIHLPVLIGDYPNHDGLSSMYFDQNMITSGRWFLIVACSASSWFSVPWIIGLLSALFLGIGAVALVEFLHVEEPLLGALIGALLAVFPALASTFAYLFTADGYMMALMLVFLALAVTDRDPKGFLAGGVLLAFSMGIYQSYLAFAIVLALFGVARAVIREERPGIQILHFAGMGVIGVALYYVILQVLLLAEGKVLDTYQGINGLAEGAQTSLLSRLMQMYTDFAAFTLRGNVLYNNVLSLIALLVLLCSMIVVLIAGGYLRKWQIPGMLLLFGLLLPPAMNMILAISPNVTYHLLMRYQWVLLPIGVAIFGWKGAKSCRSAVSGAVQWALFLSLLVLIGNYAVTDNIAYTNLEKKYEKTYAYCLRLADRMEQTEGYYQGIPVAMVGVQSKDAYPETDITGSVTSNMIGMNGDYLIYTDTNYQEFMKYYLGITIELVSDEEMERIYQTPEYQALDTFPGPNSMQVVDGILYIKTE